jgi:type IV secretion system protein VirD4
MKHGIRIGYWDRSCQEPLTYRGEAHGSLFGGNRKGKFRDILAQIYMTFRGSVLSVCPKGQAPMVTSRYRRDVLGQEVRNLDPFGILPEHLGRRAQFDPLSTLDPGSPTFAVDSDNLAEAYLLHGGPDSHWVESGRILCSGSQMWLRKGFSGASLASLYQLISGPDLFAFAQDAVKKSNDPFITARLSRFADPDAAENKEVRSIISCAMTQLGFIGNKPVAESLSATTIDFREMKRRPMTVNLTLGARYQSPCSKWFRIMVNSAMDGFMHEGERDVPVLVVLDEFSSTCGRLGIIETAMGLGAGYGVQLLPVLQDISQLKGLFPQTWETFIANSGFSIFLPPRDLSTSDYVSRMVGTTEIRSFSKSIAERQNGEASVNLSYGQQPRRQLLPEEVRDLPGDEMLVFAEGIPGVIRAGRRPYYLSPEFAGKYDPDPYHKASPHPAA